jgi:hypothetical protein
MKVVLPSFTAVETVTDAGTEGVTHCGYEFMFDPK